MSTGPLATPASNTPWQPSALSATLAPPPGSLSRQEPHLHHEFRAVILPGRTWPARTRSPWKPSSATQTRVVMTLTRDELLTLDDMPAFTRLRMTAFGQAVIDIANDPAFDEWTFSAKIRHAQAQESSSRRGRTLCELMT